MPESALASFDSDTRPTPTTSTSKVFTQEDAEAVYELAGESSPIGKKVKHALEVVERAIQLYSIHNLALSFNGGKDCTVLIHLLSSSLLRLSPSSVLPSIPTIYVRQPSPFPQEEYFTSLCSRRYSLELEAVQGESMKDSLRVWIENRKDRLGEEKGEVKGVLVGTRRTDPHGANLTSFDPTDPTWPSFMRVHPILDWSYHDVWEFLRHPKLTLGGKNGGGIEWCELYDYGYTSIGSTHSTFPNPCLRQTPPSASPFPSSSSSTPPTPHSITTQIGNWLPAWELVDETQERAGREVSLREVVGKAEELRKESESRSRSASRERGNEKEGRRIEVNGNGKGNGERNGNV
ncbi:FMN adenylyltransferase [Sporobolomyces salmoneus]|uniref:FMN adenylyltransferase n=1 Tax=Sporobolomyces salmoneus TaxID=183962 RepID=UPI0031759D57